MNQEGLKLLAAVIERNAALKDAIKRGDCKVIAADLNGWMPPDMQVTAVDVYQALKGHPAFAMPKHNAEVLRDRIDAIPALYSARINTALKGEAGIGAIQTIMNELNLVPNHEEHVTFEDVVAAMELKVVPKPEKVAKASAELIGKARIG